MRRTSILDGMSLADLQARLSSLQKAYLDLSSGAKFVTASYTQGDGAKSVTYTQANIKDLTQIILMVQGQIASLSGQGGTRRRPMRVFF
jgi:hypothetical protein